MQSWLCSRGHNPENNPTLKSIIIFPLKLYEKSEHHVTQQDLILIHRVWAFCPRSMITRTRFLAARASQQDVTDGR